MVLQWPTDGADASGGFQKLLLVDLSRRELATRAPDDGAGADELRRHASHPASAAESTIAGMSRWMPPSLRGRGLVTSSSQHDGIDGIAAQDLHESQVRKVAIERRRRRRQFSKMGCMGNPSARRPRRECLRARRFAVSRCTRLHGVRSPPVWAIPMMGLPLSSSSAVRPYS